MPKSEPKPDSATRRNLSQLNGRIRPTPWWQSLLLGGVRLGVLGVGLGVAFQVVYWRTLWRLRQRVAGRDPAALMLTMGLAGSMADLLAHGLVDVGYFAINLAFVFFLSLAMLIWLDQRTAGVTAQAVAVERDRGG